LIFVAKTTHHEAEPINTPITSITADSIFIEE
jgi:hypothetical protein